jgi:acyl dehydratase
LLHCDPAIARRAGFDRPIPHGPCTLGISARMLIRTFGGETDGHVRYDGLPSLSCRLTAPVLPGQTLTISAWRDQCGPIRFEVPANGTRVLERAELLLGQEAP